MSQSRFASRQSGMSLSRRSVAMMSEARMGEAKTAGGNRLGVTVQCCSWCFVFFKSCCNVTVNIN